MKIVNFCLKYAGICAIPAYIVFTFIAHLYNPQIQPLSNWLSDYGNYVLNPSSALFYNTGLRIVALFLAVFYIGLFRWYRPAGTPRKYVICYVLAQISGIAETVFLVLTTVFTLGSNTELHSLFAMANMVGLNCFMCFTAVGLLMNPKINKLIGILGFLTSTFNIVTMNAFENLYISEWIYFLLFMAYIAIITIQYDKLAGLGVKSRAVEANAPHG